MNSEESRLGKAAALVVDRVDQVPAYRKVYAALENLIYTGELKPGALLPNENDLAERFGVTRSTIREGIRLLEQSGLVDRPTPKRLAVSRPELAGLASQASRGLLMHDVTFSELWETLTALEPVTTGLAARRATPEMLEELERNVALMRQNIGNMEEFIRLDVEFHDLVGQAAANRALLLARESVSLLIERSGVAILPKLLTYTRIIEIHELILQAMKKHDEQEAERQMRRHMNDFKRGYELAGFRPDERLVAS
jgi:DNA-binding FadR family transcriptional regulator